MTYPKIIYDISLVNIIICQSLDVEYKYVNNTSAGIAYKSSYIKDFQFRMYRIGKVVYVNGNISFTSAGVNIDGVISGLPFQSPTHFRWIAGTYNLGANNQNGTAMLDIGNGAIGLIGGTIGTYIEYNFNFTYIVE